MAATLVEVMKFFGFQTSETAKFRAEWNELSPESQKALKEGIGNGTYTY